MDTGTRAMNRPMDSVVFTVLDTETTGANPGDGHEIIEFGMAHYSGRKVMDTFEVLVRPTGPLSREAASVHGIPPEELEKAPRLEEVIESVLRFIGDTVIVAHNVNFDMTFLHTALRGLGRPVLDNWAIDTIQLSQRMWPELTCHCLACLGPSLGLPHSGTHRALGDVYATTELLDRLICELQKRGKSALGDLSPFRRDYTWREGDFYRELQRNFLCAIREKALVHLCLYDKRRCLYFRKTVEPLELLENGSLRARPLGEERPREFPLHDVMKVTPAYRE